MTVTGAFNERPFNAAPFNAGDIFTDTVSDTCAVTGSVIDGLVYDDSGAGTILVSGTCSDIYSVGGITDIVHGTCSVTGSLYLIDQRWPETTENRWLADDAERWGPTETDRWTLTTV